MHSLPWLCPPRLPPCGNFLSVCFPPLPPEFLQRVQIFPERAEILTAAFLPIPPFFLFLLALFLKLLLWWELALEFPALESEYLRTLLLFSAPHTLAFLCIHIVPLRLLHTMSHLEYVFPRSSRLRPSILPLQFSLRCLG